MKLFVFFLFIVVFFSPFKVSATEADSWVLDSAFFLERKCYISVRNTTKENTSDRPMANSSLMVIDCSEHILKTHRYNSQYSSRQLRTFACHNNGYVRRCSAYPDLFKEALYEVDLFKDFYLRSMIISILRKPLNTEGGLSTSFFQKVVLDSLEADRF